MWKNDRPLIASFGDNVVVAGRVSLQLNQVLANAGIVGRIMRDGR